MKLVGIARLAASGEVLESKRQVDYVELPSKSILNRVQPNGRVPFEWAINPYRGCEFGCKYCYARYTHEFMELDPDRGFEERIFSKRDAARLLRKDLRKVRRGETIAIGTATDPYQPAERRFGVMRSLLEVFAMARGLRLGITTKSDLIARDADLLAEIARSNVLMVMITVTTMDADLARSLEPRAPRPDLRIGALRELTQAGVDCSVFCSPAMPRINDSVESLRAVAVAAQSAGAVSFGARPLFLQPVAQKVFLPYLDGHFPQLAAKYHSVFDKSAYLGQAYADQLEERVRTIVEPLGFPGWKHKRREAEPESQQMELFQPAPLISPS